MKTFAPENRELSIPFHLTPYRPGVPWRLGGFPPEGLALASMLAPSAQYVMTFPLSVEPRLDASVFVNCAFDELVEAMNDGLQTDDRIVVVRHEPTSAEAAQYPSALGATEITLWPQRRDMDAGELGAVPFCGHKLGGRAYSIQEPELPGTDELVEAGFVQVVQLDFPGPPDVLPTGSWPFGDGLFNLFWQPPFTAGYCWVFQG